VAFLSQFSSHYQFFERFSISEIFPEKYLDGFSFGLVRSNSFAVLRQSRIATISKFESASILRLLPLILSFGFQLDILCEGSVFRKFFLLLFCRKNLVCKGFGIRREKKSSRIESF